MVGASPFLITILQRKDSPYRDKITLKMLEIEAAGLYHHKFTPDTEELIEKMTEIGEKVVKDELKMFRLENLFLVFEILSLFLFLSVAVFVVEFYFPEFDIK